MSELTRGTVLEFMVGPDLFKLVRIAITKHDCCLAQLILLVEILQVTWTKRSLVAYQKKNFTFRQTCSTSGRGPGGNHDETAKEKGLGEIS